MSTGSQKAMIWWGLAFMTVFGLALCLLIKVVPPVPADWTAAQIKEFYLANSPSIRIGALLSSYTSAFMVPIAVVVAVQMARVEKGVPIWAILQLVGGVMMSLFLVLSPIMWGVAAFEPTRPAETTALMHQFAWLTLTTTDQYYIFQMVAIAVISLKSGDDPYGAFPRWLGYFTAWAAFMLEAGALAFAFKRGPFAWDGLFVFWSPLAIFGCWVGVLSFWMLRTIERQRRDGL